jgi:hypothetical protein
MGELVKRAIPGTVAALVAIGSVIAFDREFNGELTQDASGVSGVAGAQAQPVAPKPVPAAPTPTEQSPSSQNLAPSAQPPSDPMDGSPMDGNMPMDSAASCDTAPSLEGPEVSTPWGPVQVVAKVTAAGVICSAEAVEYPTLDRKSASINSSAIPMLNRTSAEQGAEFDAVSGATYTSEAYRDSLQALLDAL